MLKNIIKKISKIVLIPVFLVFFTSCDNQKDLYFKIDGSNVIWAKSFFRFKIDTNIDLKENEVEFISNDFSWFFYNETQYVNNVFSLSIMNIYGERGTAFLTVKCNGFEDTLKIHYKAYDEFELVKTSKVLEPGKTYDFDWNFINSDLNDSKFAIELFPIQGLDCFNIVDQYKIETIKPGKIKFGARIDQNIKTYEFEII